MARPIIPLQGFNVRPGVRVEFRNDHGKECTCLACVMVRLLKRREISAEKVVREWTV